MNGDGNKEKIEESTKIAKAYGFEHPAHLLFAMKKYCGKIYHTVQEIPTEEIIECQQLRIKAKT